MEPTPLTPQIWLTLGITVGAVVLFAWNRVRADMAALIIMAIVIVAGLVTPAEGLSGFSNEATATVALMPADARAGQPIELAAVCCKDFLGPNAVTSPDGGIGRTPWNRSPCPTALTIPAFVSAPEF